MQRSLAINYLAKGVCRSIAIRPMLVMAALESWIASNSRWLDINIDVCTRRLRYDNDAYKWLSLETTKYTDLCIHWPNLAILQPIVLISRHRVQYHSHLSNSHNCVSRINLRLIFSSIDLAIKLVTDVGNSLILALQIARISMALSAIFVGFSNLRTHFSMELVLFFKHQFERHIFCWCCLCGKFSTILARFLLASFFLNCTISKPNYSQDWNLYLEQREGKNHIIYVSTCK